MIHCPNYGPLDFFYNNPYIASAPVLRCIFATAVTITYEIIPYQKMSHFPQCFCFISLFPVLVISGCLSLLPSVRERSINDQQLQSLRIIERNLPVTPDSVANLYLRYDPETFHKTYSAYLTEAGLLVDSLNAPLPVYQRIDTLAIDHAFENIGQAAHQGNSIYLSSSYFYLYNDPAMIRSVIYHEFGHLYYRLLTPHQLRVLTEVWLDLHDPSGFYLFRDGEYPHNSRFGGHPEDSPSELFASAFNLFCNNAGSLDIRSWLLPEGQRPVLERLRDLVHEVTNRPAARGR